MHIHVSINRTSTMAEAPDIRPRDQNAPLPTGGYECEFVDSLPDFLTCLVCFLPFRDPHLLDCCGVKICATCVARIDVAGQPCPHCREELFLHILDQNTRREVLSRKVRCPRKKDGCKWEGELRYLEEHEREECAVEIKESFMRKMRKHHQEMEERLTSEMEHHQREMAAVRKQMEQLEQSLKEIRGELHKCCKDYDKSASSLV